MMSGHGMRDIALFAFSNEYALCMINGGLYADGTERQMVLSTAGD